MEFQKRDESGQKSDPYGIQHIFAFNTSLHLRQCKFVHVRKNTLEAIDYGFFALCMVCRAEILA